MVKLELVLSFFQQSPLSTLRITLLIVAVNVSFSDNRSSLVWINVGWSYRKVWLICIQIATGYGLIHIQIFLTSQYPALYTTAGCPYM
jgi:hypothetical protein